MSKIIYRSPKSTADFKKYYDLRWRILRKPYNQPKGSEKNERDADAFHILSELEKQVIGIGCIHELEKGVGRIRYMAVDDKFQKRGVGQNIVKLLEKYAVEQQWQTIRLWSRQWAIEFYKKCGYKIIGKGETVFGVIPHKIMEKEL